MSLAHGRSMKPHGRPGPGSGVGYADFGSAVMGLLMRPMRKAHGCVSRPFPAPLHRTLIGCLYRRAAPLALPTRTRVCPDPVVIRDTVSAFDIFRYSLTFRKPYLIKVSKG